MSLLLSDADMAKIRDAASQVIKNAIGETANVLVPAVGEAISKAIGNVQVTVTTGPIKIEPVEITVKVSPL